MEMTDFYNRRRDRLLNEAPYTVLVKGRNNAIRENQELITQELPALPLDDPAYVDWSWGIATSRVRLIVGRYSAGDSLSDIATDFPAVLQAVEDSVLPHAKYKTEPLHLDELDAYAYGMWLLSLAKLLRLDHLVPRVAALFDVDRKDNRGQDALYETLLAKLGLPSTPATRCYQQLKAHPLLLDATQADSGKRAKLVAQFLDKWYPAMKGCYWHGIHTKVPQGFFGYWAFEAGLVTYLWDIDDTSYRDMPFYPKDLVAYARSQQATAPLGPATHDTPRSTPSGQPCPRTGFWLTPAQIGSRRFFKTGELMPSVGSDYGTTIWQWDANQEPPKL